MVSPIDVPVSDVVVSVKVIRAFNRIALPSAPFFSAIPGSTIQKPMVGPGYAFLVEHPNRTKIVFDNGIRKDTQNLAPALLKRFKWLDLDVGEDVAGQLSGSVADLTTISALIWSHCHVDHVGDVTRFPTTTSLVVGQGTLAHTRPGYPLNPDSAYLESDFEGREVIEIAYDGPVILGARSHDYFGDGSFYLIDMPGHCPGHIAGLARVTASSSNEGATFILMAGDTVHHPGLLRPSKQVPMPEDISSELPPYLKQLFEEDKCRPLLVKSPPGIAVDHDPALAQRSVERLQMFDAQPDVWVIPAHDASLEGALEGTEFKLYPEVANDWKNQGWKEKTRWAFLKPEGKAWLWAV